MGGIWSFMVWYWCSMKQYEHLPYIYACSLYIVCSSSSLAIYSICFRTYSYYGYLNLSLNCVAVVCVLPVNSMRDPEPPGPRLRYGMTIRYEVILRVLLIYAGHSPVYALFNSFRSRRESNPRC